MSLDQSFRKHDALKIVIGQLETLGYQPPHSRVLREGETNPQYEALCELFVKDLAQFPAAVLEQGMEQFRRTWAYNRWPKIGELRQYFVNEQNLESRHEKITNPSEVPQIEEHKPTSKERELVRRQMSVLREMIKSGDLMRMSLDEGLAYCTARAMDLLYRPESPAESHSAVRREGLRQESIERAERASESMEQEVF